MPVEDWGAIKKLVEQAKDKLLKEYVSLYQADVFFLVNHYLSRVFYNPSLRILRGRLNALVVGDVERHCRDFKFMEHPPNLSKVVFNILKNDPVSVYDNSTLIFKTFIHYGGVQIHNNIGDEFIAHVFPHLCPSIGSILRIKRKVVCPDYKLFNKEEEYRKKVKFFD